jgi:hypothetical protein
VIPRQAAGTQFITGPCNTDGDCASQCCGFRTGKCAGPIIAQERDGGCGFGDGVPNDNAARVLRGQAPAAPAPPPVNNGGAGTPAPPAAGGSGKPPGTQFITGVCANDGECASGCCGFKSGKCAGPVIAQERDGGCGFGDATPNDNAARIFRGQAPAAPAAPPPVNNGGSATPAPPPPAAPPAAGGSGKAPGAQFITGPCANDGECASGCCGFNTGKCAGAIIALERDGGCGFGNPYVFFLLLLS